MNRFVDIYAASGEQLAQLGGDGITAVPAVAQFHPTQQWVGQRQALLVDVRVPGDLLASICEGILLPDWRESLPAGRYTRIHFCIYYTPIWARFDEHSQSMSTLSLH